MKLVDQWRTIEAGLPSGWEDVRLSLTTEQPGDLSRATQVLGSINAGKVGSTVVFHVSSAAGPHGVQRALRAVRAPRPGPHLVPPHAVRCPGRRGARADGTDTVPTVAPAPAGVAESWDEALAPLPSDWTDLLCELEIDSSALLDRTALLCAPLNPARSGSRVVFTFRCSGRSGYGVSPSMARRCFERLDDEGITGTTRVLRVLSDTDNVDTQGPVWLVGGKTL